MPQDYKNFMVMDEWSPIEEAALLSRQTWVKHAANGVVTDTGSMELFHTPS